MKSTNKLSDRERTVGYVLAAYGLGIFMWRTLSGGLVGREPLYLALGVVLAVALAGLARYTNRIGLSLGAVGCAVWPYGPSWQLLAYPFLGLMLYVTFAMSKSRRDLMAKRAAAGDFADPIAERRVEKKKPAVATEDKTGRSYASKSKRYTPPKAPAKPAATPTASPQKSVKTDVPPKDSRLDKVARSLGIKEEPDEATSKVKPFK
jgi:hypothetical protein